MPRTGSAWTRAGSPKPPGPAATRIVNHSRLGKALLELGDPPIRSLFVAANNPAVTCPDSVTVRRGLAREDLFTIVHDPFLSDTARYADIVLPAATYLESDDVVRSYGSYYIQMVRQVVPPQGDAWSNGRLAQELAQRLGLKDRIFSMDTDGLLRELFRGAASPAAEVDLKALREGAPINAAPKPGRQRFRTPSGKLEFYSASLAERGLPAMPDWVADPLEAETRGRFALRLLTAPGYFQAHTAYAGVAALRQRAGAPECVLHPDDAAARGLEDGQVVELHNDHGTVRGGALVSDETERGA